MSKPPKIYFPPVACNARCPRKTQGGYSLSPQSYLGIPPGTVIEIFVNDDPNDPNSDCHVEKVVVTSRQARLAVLAETLTVKTI